MFSPHDIKALLRKALAAAIAAVLGFVLLSALLIGGVVMLLEAATLGLAPWVGEAGAYGITGGVCMLLLGLFFYRLFHGPAKKHHAKSEDGQKEEPSPLNAFRKLITTHPWEAILIAFALGITEQSDPRMRQMLIQSGLAFLKVGNIMDDGESDDDSGMGQASNDAHADAPPPDEGDGKPAH